MNKFYMIPAGDVMTGKKVNTMDDILKAYEDEPDMVCYTLHVEGRSRPVFLTSFGGGNESVADYVEIEHTQSFAKFHGRILNVVHIANGKVAYAAMDIALNDGTKGAHWVMK